MPVHFDLYIQNGLLVDGSGRERFPGDIGIVDGTITYIGPPLTAPQSMEFLDADGLIVSPGFIDIHTHADIALLSSPTHLPKIMQGVTTEVFTNCGLGFAPVTEEALAIQRQYLGGLFRRRSEKREWRGKTIVGENAVDWNWRTVAEFLAQFEAQGIGANVAYLIPHGAVRVSVMGMADRPATSEELQQMQAMVAQGRDEGAWGLSTGVWYAPMKAADHTELVTLCRTAGFFATHQRDYGDLIFEATSESLAIARDAGVPLEIAHLQLNGPGNADRAGDILQLLEQARTEGVDVTCDTYPYTAGSTFVQALLPSWAVEGGPEAILRRLSEPDTRTRMREALTGRTEAEWRQYNLAGAQSAENRGLEGLTFDAASVARGMSVPEWICVLLEEEELRACFIHHAAHEGNVRTILQWPGQMVGSDGLHLPGKTHPRLYGTFPRVLGRYVREEKVLTLEQAVHKMTGMPAARLGLKQRGLLQNGYAADLVVFDPATICDTATFEDPLRYPTGIPYVFVNGIAVKEADQPTGTLPGKVLRHV